MSSPMPSEEEIRAALLHATVNNPPTPASQHRLTCAAVLIPLIHKPEGWQVLFTRRTERVETHKGQVAFPGGSCDPGDDGLVFTALRETEEEIGIPPAAVAILGSLGPMSTVTGFWVTPVVGVVRGEPVLRLAEHEVSRVFYVPLDWLAESSHYEERPYTRSNGTEEIVVFYQPYDGEIIWGVTGRIVMDFVALIKKSGA